MTGKSVILPCAMKVLHSILINTTHRSTLRTSNTIITPSATSLTHALRRKSLRCAAVLPLLCCSTLLAASSVTVASSSSSYQYSSSSITNSSRFASSRTKKTASIANSLPNRLEKGFQANLEMAWSCSGRTNAELIANLAAAKLIQSRPVYDAMLAVDRGHFLPVGTPAHVAYQDSPQLIGFGSTISAPHMHAMCLELLEPYLTPGKRALDVGSGSGYLVATMERMIHRDKASVADEKKQSHSAASKAAEQPSSASAAASSSSSASAASSSSSSSSFASASVSVIGIEHMAELVTLSHGNLDRWNKHWRDSISVIAGDGRIGLKGQQFDAIHVGAAAPKIPPALIEQLAPGGRLVIPVGTSNQHLMCIDKDENGKLTQKTITGVRYIPLTDEEKQRKSES